MQNLASPALSREIITAFPRHAQAKFQFQYSLLPKQSVHEISYIVRPISSESYKKYVYRRTFTEDRPRLAEVFLAIIESFSFAENAYIL